MEESIHNLTLKARSTDGVERRKVAMSENKPESSKIGEGLLHMWPGDASLEERKKHVLSGLYYKVPNHNYLSGIVEQWKSDMPNLSKGGDVSWAIVGISDSIEPLKTVLSVASALEFRDQIALTVVTSQDLLLVEQRLARKGIQSAISQENGLEVLSVGDYIGLVAFSDVLKNGPQCLEGRGAVCFDLDKSLLESTDQRSSLAPLMLNMEGVYYMCRRLESRYAGLKKIRNLIQGYGVPEKGILMG